MNSRDYWLQREAEQLKHNITEEAEYDRQLKRIYQNMLDACQKEIDSFYGKYASAEGITIAEAKKRVSKLDIAAYERKAARYVKDKDFSKQANEEMRLYNATMKINRLEMLKANIGLETIAGHDKLEKFMAGILKGRTEAELKRQAGILGKTVMNNAQKANAIVNGSFHSGTFSDRIWQYQDIMRQDLGKLLQQGLIQGKGARAIAKDLKKYWYGNDPKTGGGATYCMERLMRTELARVQTEAQKQSFERNGFDMYQFICNVNPTKQGTCSVCRRLANEDNGLGKGVYLVKDMMPGTNAPPMHPHCRCSTAAYEDDAEYEAWLDFLDKGGTTAEWDKAGKKEWEKLNKVLENSENGATIKSKWDNDLPPRGQVTEKIDEDDLYSWVANELGVSEQEATDYVDAVMTFTDAGSDYYSEIRRYQRNEPLQFLSLEEVKKLSDDIEKYIQIAPRWNSGTTFRGSTVSDDELATYITGKKFTAGGTSSWSATQKIAKDFATRNATAERPNSVIYHCETQSKGTGIRHISVYEFEDEVLCSKESEWEIVRTEMDSEFITHVYVKEV